MQEKTISYKHTNTYTTNNIFTSKTKNVWLALHGMGYLSKYFIKYFKDLDPLENYIIAPQAHSKYYQDKKYKYIGASWLTKEQRDLELENVYRYLDQVWLDQSNLWKDQDVTIICLGYSQGVSILTRWIANRKINCNHIILHSGAIPEGFNATSFNHLLNTTKIHYHYGNNDEFITPERILEQKEKAYSLFSNKLSISVFDGKHEVDVSFIKKVSLLNN